MPVMTCTSTFVLKQEIAWRLLVANCLSVVMLMIGDLENLAYTGTVPNV